MGFPALLNRSTGWTPVGHLATLKSVEARGYIELPRWGRRDARFVRYGKNAPGMKPFTIGRRTFRIGYLDGCLEPFLFVFTPAKV